MELKNEENIILKTQVTYHKNNMEKIPGELTVTNKKMSFKSMKACLLQENFNIEKASIIKVEKKNSMLIIPDISKITTVEGKVYNISMVDREKLINWAMESNT